MRVEAVGRLKKPAERTVATQSSTEPKGERRVFVRGEWREVVVFARSGIPSHAGVAGPLIVEEAHATHFVPPEWRLTTAPTGDLIATKVPRSCLVTKKPLDAIQVEVIRNALVASAEEMGVTIWRTSRSSVVRDLLDYSTCMFDAEGRASRRQPAFPCT